MLHSPMFVPLHPILAELRTESFPSLEDCNALLDKHPFPIGVQIGKPLRFVPQDEGKLSFEAQYEPRCYLKGEVSTRSGNLHDLLNSLVWLTFPRTKAVLNARHYNALVEERALGKYVRSPVRDVNTLFDESGVIVLHIDPKLADLLKDHEWKELFWNRRGQVNTQMRFFIFGHGLYEKALRPYLGITGHGLVLPVTQAFFDWPLRQQLGYMDDMLAEYLALPEHCRSTRDLSPVPLLGVPGWDTSNGAAAYYDNTTYFRPLRRK